MFLLYYNSAQKSLYYTHINLHYLHFYFDFIPKILYTIGKVKQNHNSQKAGT